MSVSRELTPSSKFNQ